MNECMVIMGIHVDAINRTIAIPEGKMAEITQAVEDFSLKTFMTALNCLSPFSKAETITHTSRLVQVFSPCQP